MCQTLSTWKTNLGKSLNSRQTSNLEISFQRFEKDWEEYVEVDRSCNLNKKAKLKAVVTPLLVTEAGSESEVCLTVTVYFSTVHRFYIFFIYRQPLHAVQQV